MHPGTPRDVDLEAWKNEAAFHPADTRLKQLGHELARKAVVALGELLHWLLPPGRAKALAYTHLELVRLYANMALASGKGPQLLYGDAAYTEDAVEIALRNYRDVDLPEDPRIAQYKENQLAPGLDAALEKAHADGSIFSERPTLPGADADAPRSGLTGVARQEAAEPAIHGEQETAPEGTFHWTDEGRHVQVDVYGKDGEVQLILTDQDHGVSIAKVLDEPLPVNQILSAMAAAGDLVFTR